VVASIFRWHWVHFFFFNTSFWLHSKHSKLLKLHLNFQFWSVLSVLVCVWLFPNKVNWLNKIQIFPYSFHGEHILSFFDMLCIICTEFTAYTFDEFKYFGIICNSFKQGSPVGYSWRWRNGQTTRFLNKSLPASHVLYKYFFFLKKFMNWYFESRNKMS